MRKLLMVAVWTVVLFIFTCTGNLEGLLFHQKVFFVWNSHPDFRDLLIMSDAHVTSPYWLIIKTGHFTGFAILEVLVYRLTHNQKIALSSAIFFAVFTEILQLYFGRDGRLLDIAIDSAGALLSRYIIHAILLKRRQNATGL